MIVEAFLPLPVENSCERTRLAVALESTIGRTDRSLERALTAARTADLNRGRDIVVLDLRELTSLFDYFVLATGSSRRQLHSISEEIDQVFERDFGDRRLGLEGYVESRWILLDFGDVVVHLFDEETRDYYALEQLWSGSKRVAFESSAPPVIRPR
jgi:ribosome-associated protein